MISGNIAKATELTEALLAKNPADLDARLLKASIMSRQGNDRGAIQLATDIVSAQPGHSEAVTFLAAIYLLVQQPKREAQFVGARVQFDGRKQFRFSFFHIDPAR